MIVTHFTPASENKTSTWKKRVGSGQGVLPFTLFVSAFFSAVVGAHEPEKSTPTKAANHVDQLGDPLPPEALLRCGTARLRHGDWIYCLAWSPDGKAILTGARNAHDVRLWDAGTGKELQCFRGHTWGINSGFFVSGGKRIVTYDDTSLRCWDVETGKELWLADLTTCCIVAMPDGKSVLGATVDEVRLFDAGTGTATRTISALPGEKTVVNSAALTRDGKMLALGRENAIEVWNLETEKRTLKFKPVWEKITGLAFKADGKILAAVAEDGCVLYNAETGKALKTIVEKKQSRGGYAVAISPDGKYVVCQLTDSDANSVGLFDIDSGKEIRRFSLSWQGDVITSLAFAPDGKTLAAGGNRGFVYLWDVATGKEARPDAVRQRFLRDRGNPVLSHDGNLIAELVRNDDRTHLFEVWDVHTSKKLQTFQFPGIYKERWLAGLEFSLDGTRLSATGSDGLVMNWEVVSGEAHKQQLEGFPDNGRLMSRRGNILALAGEADNVTFRTALTGKPLSEASGHVLYAVSSDGKRLVFGDRYYPATLTDVDIVAEKARSTWKLAERPFGGYSQLALHPDSDLGATNYADDNQRSKYHVLLFSLKDGRELRHVAIPKGRIDSLLFSPDGRTLAGGAEDANEIYLWEAATGRLRAFLHGHTGSVRQLCFSGTGQVLASSSDDTTTLVWDLARCGRDGASPPPKLTGEEVTALWKDLQAIDAQVAYRAMWGLAAAPQDALPMLRKQLPPVPNIDGKQLQRWLSDLGHDDFATREAAFKELARRAEAVEADLNKLLDSDAPPEGKRRAKDLLAPVESERFAPSAERRQQLRAVESLEHMNTKEARQWLEELAKGHAGAWLTKDAKAALSRLGKP
jgi:WD40 repeat protein